jgi:molybdopterin synthase sulfur carrier subunit
MKVTVLLFGQLAEVVGSKELQLIGYIDTTSLVAALHQQFPLLAQSKYVVAVNQQMISGNISLTENSIVALLPPFSGG